jgi:hypothetical protein
MADEHERTCCGQGGDIFDLGNFDLGNLFGLSHYSIPAMKGARFRQVLRLALRGILEGPLGLKRG